MTDLKYLLRQSCIKLYVVVTLKPDDMYIVYNTVTSNGQLACKTKHSICKHARAIMFICAYDTYRAALMS